ncbi:MULTISPECIES: restriction endonuclease [Pseudomonadota]|jgi:restriction system protein|uniref:restriction endonuclease n=1 Tax=Pseudomonadota TaxID=1224 RepID=UPI001909B8EA|nr:MULTISPECIES: restriction endonuclease [Pseudomonadota]MBC7285661.1 restriction endonuclease [Hoeflea sp.]MBK3758218.1 restriction endonuclease [Stutzerimonas frequens]MBK3872494.1 restriction endonuclease [Stutzerimonas frequens]MBK3910517.1 restriction endonuclease [Stutzerimonas frequens]MBK3929778.1 restriction endonuclease [Stutzerimonas frequens]
MARRRKQSPFEDLIDLAALMPWWITLPLALIAYLWLNSIVTSPIPAPANPPDLGSHMSGMMLRGLAVPAQYFVPAALVFGAIASIFGRLRRKKLFDSVASDENTLESISWREFELLVGEAFRRKGFTVQETGQGGADGGIDLVLLKDGEKYLVQCKQWRRQLVQVNVIRELFGVMTAEGAKGGFVVISGRFTEDAKTFAQGKNLQLIEGAELNDMIRQSRMIKSRQVTRPATSKASNPRNATPTGPVPSPSAAQVSCPVCQAPMVRRVAKRGSNAGSSFWGCSQYPKCKAIRTEATA